MDDTQLYACELCGGGNFSEIPRVTKYTGGQPIHVCEGCGFVQVIRRRSPQRIADEWSNELYADAYRPRIPAVTARQTFVAEMVHTTIGMDDRSVADIGAGEGQFLAMISKSDYGARVFGIEPSTTNCTQMRQRGIECFAGTIEDYLEQVGSERRFDIVTILWTLENCNSCQLMLNASWRLLKDNGYLVVATGSRILVPFKKPLGYYLDDKALDTHAFRFSAGTLTGLMAKAGFEVEHSNRYLDHDVLCMIARRTDRAAPLPWKGDDWRQVCDFFRRWDDESQHYG